MSKKIGKKTGPKKVKKAVKKKKKIKPEKTDGLGPVEIRKIRTAIRQVWHRCHARKLCVERCVGPDGFSYCEKCKKRSPKVLIDHIKKVGDVDGGFIERLFCPSKQLQGLCKTCHDAKTKEERAEKKLKSTLKKIKKENRKIKDCENCEGEGVVFKKGYAFDSEKICATCDGTGKELDFY